MIEITTRFILPGEGAIIDGAEITPDTPIVPDQLEYMPGTPHYFARLTREAQSREAQAREAETSNDVQ